MRTSKRLVPVASAVVVVLLSAGCGDDDTEPAAGGDTTTTAPASDAEGGDTDTTSPQSSPEAAGGISAQEAEEIALDEIGGSGTVVGVEAGEEDGVVTWEVEVVDDAGEEQTVSIDQATGEVLSADGG